MTCKVMGPPQAQARLDAVTHISGKFYEDNEGTISSEWVRLCPGPWGGALEYRYTIVYHPNKEEPK